MSYEQGTRSRSIIFNCGVHNARYSDSQLYCDFCIEQYVDCCWFAHESMLDGVGEKFYVRSRTTKSANRASHQFGWFKAQHIGIMAVNVENGVWKVYQDSHHVHQNCSPLHQRLCRESEGFGAQHSTLSPTSPFEFGGCGRFVVNLKTSVEKAQPLQAKHPRG